MSPTDADFIARRLDSLGIPTHRDGKPIPLAARIDLALSRWVRDADTLSVIRTLVTP